MEIHKNYKLKKHNTFGVESIAKEWISVNSVVELQNLIKIRSLNKENHFIIGGGSNLLFADRFDGLIIKPYILGISIEKETKTDIYIKVGAGIVWDEFVNYCVENKYWGIENLSLIPGTVGASPVQNIGAYGVEVKECIFQVVAIHKSTGQIRIFNHHECQFGYRSSFFKQEEGQQWIVTDVIFKLLKIPQAKLSYNPLNSLFSEKDQVSIEEIRKTIIGTRLSKLPNPEEIGNAGSFFKNPVVDLSSKNKLLKSYPKMPFFVLNNNEIKLAAAWLIEQAGWKGFRKDDYGVHQNQALVLVNYNKASGKQILKLSQDIQYSVKQKFDVNLEREVIWIE